ncbi:MAG: hypothetical protein WCA08_03515 [Desulfoferrobacter sp.]
MVMRRFPALVLLLALIGLAACTQNNMLKASGPALQEEIKELNEGVSNEYFDAVLSVQWSELRPCCKEFHLQVINNTDKTMQILWEKTSYIQDGVPTGGFVFPVSVCDKANNPATVDSIAPHKTFTTVIWPSSLAHVVDSTKECRHDTMQSGKNGIHLMVKTGDDEADEKIILELPLQQYPFPQ